jgi:hypothetical protein
VLAKGEGREVAICGGKHSSSRSGGWSRVLSRKNSVFLRVSGAAAWLLY